MSKVSGLQLTGAEAAYIGVSRDQQVGVDAPKATTNSAGLGASAKTGRTLQNLRLSVYRPNLRA
jgi:hypothetical protein